MMIPLKNHYDVNKMDTLKNVVPWVKNIHYHANDIPIVLVGTKKDLTDSNLDNYHEIHHKAKEIAEWKLIETSAKLNINVSKIFESLTCLIIDLCDFDC